MPRQPPSEPTRLIGAKLRRSGVAYLDRWVTAALLPDRSELIRRMIAYSSRHMPLTYDPKHDQTPVRNLPCETPPTTTPDPTTGSPPTSGGKSRRRG